MCEGFIITVLKYLSMRFVCVQCEGFTVRVACYNVQVSYSLHSCVMLFS